VITRKIKMQLLVFLLVAVAGIVYTGLRYAGLDAALGIGGYPVTVQLGEGGGLFTNAEVTYRGMPVGSVTGMHLTADGVSADLRIHSDAPSIPDDLQAVVTDRSAVGEQYLDLRPATASGPYLRAGSVIARNRTALPPSTQSVLTGLDTFTRSVPTDDLRTVVDELGTAFGGTGPQLQTLLDSSQILITDANTHLPQTVRLLQDGNTVLTTQNQQASAITSFSTDLAALAGRLKRSDPDLRRLIGTAPQLADQVTGLLTESGSNLSVLIANLLTTSNVVGARLDGLEMALVAYPSLAAGSYTVAPGDGTVHFGLALNLFDPPPCIKGYESTPRRSGLDTAPTAPNTQVYCAEPPGSPVAVRGAQNAPRSGKPTEPTHIYPAPTWYAPAPDASPLPPLPGLLPQLPSLPLVLDLPLPVGG
jgi:phospholipid/cholesterol/gamma-HCH transport system substrate-binding protein